MSNYSDYSLEYSKGFVKALNKLPHNKKKSVLDMIELFTIQPNSPKLRNHRLKGYDSDTWSLSAGGNLRVHYKFHYDTKQIMLVAVGTHSQLYK